MPKLPSLEEMLKAGVHFGHKTSRWHPKMSEFIFGARQGVHIVDLEKTQEELEKTLNVVKGIASRGGIIMFVGSKRQAQAIVVKAAEDCGMPHVTERWLGGTITNFGQLNKSLKRLKTLKEKRDKGELRKYTKREQLMLSREIEEMEFKLGGIQHLEKIPDAIFVVDARNEKTAVQEAKVVGVKVIALVDTNVNPKNVDHIIPGNDDSVKSIQMICDLVAEAIKEGKASPTVTEAPKKTTKEEK